MRRNVTLLILVSIMGLSVVGVASSAQTLLGTAFTYQGFLKDNGNPANGTYDLAFALFDAASGPAQVGSTVFQDDVSVADGVFVVQLDFGLSPFDGNARWLEIGVRPGADTGGYTTLTPRQPVTPAPYALIAPRQHSLAAVDGNPANALVVDASGRVGINNPSPSTTLSVGGLIETNTGYLFPDGSVQTTSADNLQRLVANFVVAANETIYAGDVVSFLDGVAYKGPVAFGSESVFNEATSDRLVAAALSETQFVVAFRDGGNSNYGTAVIGDVAGGTVTFGAEYVFNDADLDGLSVAALSSSKFVITYSDSGNSYHATAIIGDVSGTTIAFGAEYVFNSSIAYHLAVVPLSLTTFMVAYADTGSHTGTAVIGTVSGNTIAFGSPAVFGSTGSWHIAAAALTRNKVVIVHSEASVGYGAAIIADVVGTTITFGSWSAFTSASISETSVAALSSTKFVLAYRDSVDAFGKAIIGDVSGNVIDMGAPAAFRANTTLYVNVIALSPTRFLVAHWMGVVVMGNVTGRTITFGADIQFNLPSGASWGVAMAPLTENRFAIAFRDASNSSYGTAIVGDFSSRTVGIARQSRSAGQTMSVIISGVSAQHSGLTPGQLYYQDEVGALTTTPSPWPVGLAISANEILLDIDFFGP